MSTQLLYDSTVQFSGSTITGASFRAGMCGADQDTMGKSCGQAETEAFKRFLTKLFRFTSKDEVLSGNSTETNDAPFNLAASRPDGIGFQKPGCISGQQRSELYNIARKNGYSDAAFKEAIRSHRYHTTWDIKEEDYQPLLKEFSSQSPEKV